MVGEPQLNIDFKKDLNNSIKWNDEKTFAYIMLIPPNLEDQTLDQMIGMNFDFRDRKKS